MARRGSEKRQRTKLLNLRLSPEEDAYLRRIAAIRGKPMATLLREALVAVEALPPAVVERGE